MNISSLAIRYLRIQKRRTILTAVGVTLAVALVAGTGILISSFQQMRIKQGQAEEGTWHYHVSNIAERSKAEQLKSNALFQKAGIAAYDMSLHVGKKDGQDQTIPLYEYDTTALSMAPEVVTQGRAPRNSNEIMLSTSAKSFFPSIKLGDPITIPYGIFTQGDSYASSGGSSGNMTITKQSSGNFTQKDLRAFTVVGFFRRGFYDYENAEYGVTLNPTGEHAYSVYAQIKPMLNFPASIRKAVTDCGISKDNISENGIVEWMGKSAATKIKTAITTTFVILAIIILAITMLVIRNSFAMSVADKISEIGTLRCLGAGPGHIRSLVLSEALAVWGVAAPVGLLLGTGAMAVVIAVVRSLDPTDFRYLLLAPGVWPYLLAVVLSLLTVLLSAFGPVRMTMRIPMIEAVRGNAVYRDSRIHRNRKGRLLGQVFGFQGLLAAKNIRRSPRRFRTTVLSVVASVVLFITVGGFAASVAGSLQTAMRMMGADYEFSADSNKKSIVQALNDMEQKVRGMSGISGVQRTSVYSVELDVPIKRVPQKYLKTYREFRGTSVNETDAGVVKEQLLAMEVSRENYNSLNFEGKAPSYDELVKSGGALLCETSALYSSGGRFANVAFANYRPGENVSVVQTVSPTDDKKDEVKQTFPVSIAGVLSELPWFSRFSQQADGVLVFPEGETARFETDAFKKAATSGDSADSEIFLEIRYAKGAEKQVDAQLRKMSDSGMKSGLGFLDYFYTTVSMRNNYLIMLIFVGGFAAVIILISCINLFNTIHANLQTRKREIAMTRAIGMDQSQLRSMLLLECSLYGIIGTFWGAVIGLPLQYLLHKSFNMVFASDMQAPLLMTLVALVATSGIGILAGLSSIRHIIKAPIVEEIRAQE